MSKIFGGRYEVLERIGAGGMAIVYKAKDILLNRVVTIKVLREQFVTDEDFIRRFRREAQSAASLSHPNIVSVYDVGKDGDTEYIVMEYVEGRNLKEIIREYAPLSTDQSINLGLQIIEAIKNAHEHHIIHRDIKPHNILVTVDGHAKVTDFGIARAVSSATVTHTGDIIGSVHYLSPEQAKGLQSNEQSDIYSLGIILYELITGKVPYDGETPITIALKHLQEQPILPSKINPRIEKEFETVIMRAIAKSPEQRYLSAKDLLEDLKHIQAGRPITQMEIPQTDDPEATQTHKGMSKILAPITVNDSIEKNPILKDSPLTKLKRMKRLSWIMSGLVLAFILIVGWMGWSYFRVETTLVPDVVGMTKPVAEDFLAQAKLKLSPDVTYDFSDDIEKDRIVSQVPKAGDSVKEGRQVTIVVSKGPDVAVFPDVTTEHLSKEDAVNRIETEGFLEKNITYDTKPSAIVPKDCVSGQDPAAGSTWTKNKGTITLTISEGPELIPINMPYVIGKTSTDATKILSEDNKLVVQLKTEDSTTFPKDVVMSTTPNPGEAVNQGDTVTVIVSRGPGPMAYGTDPNVTLAQIFSVVAKTEVGDQRAKIGSSWLSLISSS
ncbi:Stk1 family PASTA domain-containing Ser/Thr kinase [Desulfosporosinus sp. BG]|uniref:Stk1 family PASTA domain-containing Ser/Thr kinase n=1 Tax=Desulfosporosinus sp. BG TaxID=1633135 RepID=UPI00083B16A9|nr:Stk1 family PASTA domain-containing Ser/Thr kinase [Desulfosporosinus sp. BG]ODA40944.1 Serine/threonine protein kinase PrkC, regulator of stationary phase [Desulfosporosinus sp. BG]